MTTSSTQAVCTEAAGMTAAKSAGMAATETAGVPAATAMTSAMLSPDRQGQGKGNHDNGPQPTHTQLL